jgi:uncharacterized phage-associated protein
MHQKFNSEKTIEAAAVIARYEGKRISRLRLLKLLYIADRLAIKRRGRPLLGSKSVAMDHGPLHSDIYDMIKGEHPSSPRWSRFFTTIGKRDLRLTREPENLSLSRSEIDLLNQTAEQYSELNDWQLSELTHEFPEWNAAYSGGTSRPIELEDIIKAVDRGDDLESIVQDLADDEAYDRFFERHLH